MPETILGKVCMTPKGEYNADTAYEKLDIVTYEGTSYIVLKGVQGITPPNAEYYSLLAEKGGKGDTTQTGTQSATYIICASNSVNKEGAIVVETTLQDTLNSLFADSNFKAGSEIVVRNGTYPLDNTLNINKRCHLRFEGVAPTVNCQTINLNAIVELENVNIKYINVNYKSCCVKNCYADYISVNVSDNTIKNNKVNNIQFYSAVTNCYVYGNRDSLGLPSYAYRDGTQLTEEFYTVNDIERLTSNDIKKHTDCLICGLAGSGTEADPVLIGTEDDWARFIDASNLSINHTVMEQHKVCYEGKHFKLTADLDFSKYTSNNYMKNIFVGHIDGDGHIVKNFKAGGNVWGLIQRTLPGAVIENIGMVDVTFSGTNGSWYGGILGRSYGGTVRNCYVYGIKDGGSNKYAFGGLIGQVFWANLSGGCSVENCYVVTRYGETGYVDSNSDIRGFIGKVEANTSSIIHISRCYADIATLVTSSVAGTTYVVVNAYYVGANTTKYTEASAGANVTADELKGMAEALGSAFADDVNNVNSGYPVLV